MFAQVVSLLETEVGCLDEYDSDSYPELIRELSRVRALLDSVETLALDRFAASLGWADDGASSPVAWMKTHIGVRAGTAKARLNVGALLTRHTRIAESLGSATITFDHALLLAGIDRPVTTEQFAHDVDLLVGWAEKLSADQFAAVCRQWLALADEDGSERKARRRFERRKLHLSQLLDGNWKLDAILDAGDGAALHEAISTQVNEQHRLNDAAHHADPTLNFDTTAPQARADALAELIRRGTAAATGTPRPSVSLIIDEHSLQPHGHATTRAGNFLPGPTVQRLLCDCDINTIIVNSLGLPINLGRTARLVNPAQRRAIIARDRHCVFPGCDHPPTGCHVHHLQPWDNGGLTDIDNNYLLCGYHHHLVHEGGWTLTINPHTTHDDTTRVTASRPNGTPLRPPHRHGRRDRHRTPEFLIDRHTRHETALTRARTHKLRNPTN